MSNTDKTDTLRVRAFGKINLFLDITGRRPDGYHLIDTVMQTIDLADVLTFRRSGQPGIRLRLADGGAMRAVAGNLPLDEKNLIVKAAMLLLDQIGQNTSGMPGLEIELEKNLPMEAGLAGGSADAAASLLAVNRLFGLGLSDETLANYALKLGADVPFCLRCGTMRAQGIGEILTPERPLPSCAILLIKPRESSSTKTVYRDLDVLADPPHPSRGHFAQALAEGDASSVAIAMGNILEAVVEPGIPRICELRGLLERQGALGARMTGSGSTVFGLFADEQAAQKAAESVRTELTDGGIVFLTRPVSADEAVQERFF